jgi:hypothetical protein
MNRALEHLAETARGTFWLHAWRARDPRGAWAAVAPLLRRDALAKPATACLARHHDADALPEVLAWLRSPLGEKIQRLEREASSPDRIAAYRAFVEKLPEAGIAERRLAPLQAIQEEGRFAERNAELERTMRRAMARALAPLGQPSGDNDEDRPANDERWRFWLVTAALWAYQDVSEAELEAYLDFERSPGGVWFGTLYWQCLHETVGATEAQAAAAIKALTRRAAR